LTRQNDLLTNYYRAARLLFLLEHDCIVRKWIVMLQAFSQSLDTLYRLSQQAAPDPFRTEVLRLIRDLVSFDGAIFKTGSIVVRFDREVISERSHADTGVVSLIERHLLELATTSGEVLDAVITRSIAYSDKSTTKLIADEALLQCAQEFGTQHILLLASFQTQGPGSHWIALYRRSNEDFSEKEVDLLKLFWNHVARAIAFNLIHVVNTNDPGHRKRAMGVISLSGTMEAADAALLSILIEEWPEFDGRSLPTNALSELTSVGRYRGDKIEMLVFASCGYLICEAKRLSVFNRLAPKEKNVAYLFASGLSHGQIADQLSVAPSTVRNQLAQIYQKLDIHSKIELAQIIAKM